MTTHVKDIIDNVKNLYTTTSSLESLMDFERVLDELDTYVFANWSKGELVEGPIYDKYFVSCTFMWPYRLMPDPRGGKRLLDYKCEVSYRKESLFYSVDVADYTDFKDNTHVPKTAKKPIWLVTITIPKQLMRDIHQGSLELEAETIDIEDIEQAYEVGMEDDVYKQNENTNDQESPTFTTPATPTF